MGRGRNVRPGKGSLPFAGPLHPVPVMTTTSRIRSVAVLSTGLGLALSALPAAAQGIDPQGDSEWIEPTATDPGLFDRSDQGDFDGDGVLDPVVLREDRLEILLGPGLYDQPLLGPTGVHAFSVCPPDVGLTRGTLLVADAVGLHEYLLDPAGSAWASQLLAASWAGATVIEVRTMPSTVGVLGLMSDRRTVRCLYRMDGQWFEQPMLVSPEVVRDLCVFEFDGGGQIEIAVATDSALWVYDATGSLRQTFPVGDAVSVAIGRIVLSKSARDGLAWIVTRDEGVQQLLVLSPAGIMPPKHLAYMPLVVDMETGDVNGDGNWDVVLSHTTDHTALVLPNLGDGWTTQFEPSKPGGVRLIQFGPAGKPAPDNRARPSLGDLDSDGDTDMSFPVQSTGEMFVWRGGTVDQTSFQPAIDMGQPELACNLEALGGGDLSMTVRLDVDLPEGTPATHVELVVWRRAACELPTEPLAVQRVLVPIDGTAPQSLTATVLLPQVPDLVPGTDVRFEGMYLWAQRAVRVENGAVKQRWHARLFAIETSPDPTNYNWIKSIGGKMLFPIQQCLNGSTLPDLIGCGSELPKLPDFPGGKVPTWI